jgi:hypothetical protein
MSAVIVSSQPPCAPDMDVPASPRLGRKRTLSAASDTYEPPKKRAATPTPPPSLPYVGQSGEPGVYDGPASFSDSALESLTFRQEARLAWDGLLDVARYLWAITGGCLCGYGCR